MKISYIGSGEYCYANSLSTVLQHAGESISPDLIECLTCVGNSAMMADEIPYFNSFFNVPDEGINRSLTTLGFTFYHSFLKENEAAAAESRLAELKSAIRKGPVVVGPVEMGCLVYNPNYRFLAGADHYITVIEDKGDFLRVHDPKGYPFALLDVKNFMDAWKAEAIGYRKGSYSMWTNIERAANPSAVEIFNHTIQEIALILQKERELGDKDAGIAAIDTLAKRARNNSLAPHVIEHLTQFALPLGARRANDYYKFFKSCDEKIADLKYRQAILFGDALSALMFSSQVSFADILLQFADIETQYQELILMSSAQRVWQSGLAKQDEECN